MARSLGLLCLFTLANAYTIFDTNCTHPSTTVSFVSSVNARGTIDILWSSLFTILACTWTVLHLNVPEQRLDRDTGWRGDIKWAVKGFLTSAKWMLITVLAPELLLAKYAGDLVSALDDARFKKAYAEEDEVPWTIVHSFFANMGGFAIRSYVPERVGKQEEAGTQTDRDRPQGLDGDQEHKQPGNSITTTEADTARLHGQELYHLVGDDIVKLRRQGALSRLPYISLEELQDRSKVDSFTRAIAVVQILWTVIQICTRAARHLAISQLEIAVAAFAASAIAIYGLNWDKPKGVQVPITILQYKSKVPNTISRVLESTLKMRSGRTGWLAASAEDLFGQRHSEPGAHIGNLVVNSIFNGLIVEYLGLLLGSAIFGGIHLAAWNFHYPTRTEQLLWRIASLWCTCFCLVVTLIIIIKEKVEDALPFSLDTLENKVIELSLILYVVARLYLLVEIFRTLFFLPPSAYISTWATNVPHVA
ncbi:hypothetical protein JMJ35_000920 [Cladonia borealis]|uniref:Uncharacterized protein n=1 Tax=Cladonia borealis TaxID=184061 RepID=A0AA39R7H7_9LECA|nr:hypothetical protein JMJ35_000920 [Cladonia borealis]